MDEVPFTTAFEVDSPFGRCVAVRLPRDGGVEAGLARLHSVERVFAEGLPPLRRTTWIGGRLALHGAMSAIELGHEPILSTARGAPAMPAGTTGSISHKRAMAVAIAALSEGATVGIDLEERAPRPVDIARRVLTDNELSVVSALPEADRWPALMLRFSMKEAIYKALDPFVCRYIGFLEAEVDPHDDGSAALTLHLRGGEGPFALDGWWCVREGYVLSVVRARQTLPAPAVGAGLTQGR